MKADKRVARNKKKKHIFRRLFQKKPFLVSFGIFTVAVIFMLGFFTGSEYYAHHRNSPTNTAAPSNKPVHTEKPTPTSTPTPTIDPHAGMSKSKINGEWISSAAVEKRPIAVMMNNSKAGIPQCGLSQASVVYEAAMEGDETRLLGIFEDYEQCKRIGSVRSCRPYFVYFALEYNAIYCHFGQAWVADEVLDQSPVENVSGLKNGSDAYYRSSDRKAPHNVFTDYRRMEDTIVKLGYERNYGSTMTAHNKLANEGEVIDLAEGTPALYVKPGFPVNKPWFEYNAQDGLYYRFQYKAAQVDGNNEQQVAYRNIIIQYTDASIYEGSTYVNFNVASGGNGYYITNGKAIDITWKKESKYGRTVYYDTHGDEIRLNNGKTWICVMKTKQAENTVISEQAQ